MAVEFAKRGWNVAGGARDKAALSELKRQLGDSHFLHSFDVTNPNQVNEFAKMVEDMAGPPELLINNAGVINKNAPLIEISPLEFNEVLRINLGGIHNMIRAFIPMMSKAKRGIIVNFSSYWGKTSAAEVGPYCASKWGVEGLTGSLAQELPNGLSAVAFNPGVIDTDMLRSCFGSAAASHEKPSSWAMHAVDKLESLSVKDNGSTVIG